jgi:hypothetical protein
MTQGKRLDNFDTSPERQQPLKGLLVIFKREFQGEPPLSVGLPGLLDTLPNPLAEVIR